MAHSDGRMPLARSRIGWWLFIAILAAVAAYIAWSFAGMLVLGVFGYYATRPINDRVAELIDSDWIAGMVTVLLVLVPVIALSLYAGFQFFTIVQQYTSGSVDPLSLATQYFGVGDVAVSDREALRNVLENPGEFVDNPRQRLRTVLRTGMTVVTLIANTLLVIAMAATLSYFLLKYDDDFSKAFQQLSGGRNTEAYAYATAVDADLESVFFGNFLFVVAMAVIAGVVYAGTNFLAPAGLTVPMVVVLAFLTGVTSLIPLIVGKLIYIPVLALLAFQATQTDGTALAFVGGIAVVYFLTLDFLPQTFLQPYISGRDLDGIMLLFAYLLGPILFGWYGFFLMPIIFIVFLEAVRIVLPELLHGERLTLDASMDGSVGASPQDEGDVPSDEFADNRSEESDPPPGDDSPPGDGPGDGSPSDSSPGGD